MPKIWKNKDIEQRDKEQGEVGGGGGGEARGGNGEDEQAERVRTGAE